MRSFQGAVLFVDMLGFSALTGGKLTLGDDEYAPWQVESKGEYPHQLLAAKILIKFRKTLMQTSKAFAGVRVAQLSDCAFLWSTDVGLIVSAGRKLMHEAALMGLLCRGGLAFGNIHEPDKSNHSLGAFIVGDAVTRAATYETMGKGMRIFTDIETASRVLEACPFESISPLTNPLTGDTVDEWQWYAPNQLLSEQKSLRFRKELERIVGCHTMLRYSPKFAWNATTPEGRRQIACSIAAVSSALERLSRDSKEYIFTVEQLLAANPSRSDVLRKKVQKLFVNELMSLF
ncbi:hypothetical protein ALFP_2358 [Alcaligenes faecalis]|uniref:hypothetical protein n=1 Tax=Alcaligenes faecalis TaxID=511 RepID=UPI0007C598D3|nr:hypothetical protein [Alcaligenes faecalis]ARP54245.1 hypothetical protein ALFP_2358 [Alcaligenes faecalis]